MLAFVTNALSITTQRFLSFHQGKSKIDGQRLYFVNSTFIHFCIGLLIVFGLLQLTPLIFNGFLNISLGRTDAAKSTYYIVSIILFITFMTSPFRAVLISHENIVYLSIIDIVDGILKVIAAVCLSYIAHDKLVAYAFLIGLIQFFNLCAIGLFSCIRYPECRSINIKSISLTVVKDILSFTSWTIYSIGCVIGRTQGLAIIINKFYGATLNAAYGIAFQISGYITVISESIINAMRPQIIKAEGEGLRTRMLWLSEIASKYCTLLLCCIAIPSVALMPDILKIWLGNDVPEYATLFSRMVMIAAIFDTSTIGLVSANQAVGNIKYYSIIINSIKLLTVPAVLITIRFTNIHALTYIYISFEAICAFSRIYFLKKTSGLNVRNFITNVFGRLIVPVLVFFISVCYCVRIHDLTFRIICTYIFPNFLFLSIFYICGMDRNERGLFNSMLMKIKYGLCH